MLSCCVFSGSSPLSDLIAVQDGPTSIVVSWDPFSGATGYMISYESNGGHRGNVSVDGQSTTSWTLTNLQNGQTYTISVVATVQDLVSSDIVKVEVMLSKQSKIEMI